MLINFDDIERIEQSITNFDDPDSIVKLTLSIHKPTLAVFGLRTTIQDNFDSFVVGILNENGQIEQTTYFYSNDEKTFFEAVKKFEDLIKQNSPPPQKESPPPFAKFYFFKEKAQVNCYVQFEGTMEIVIVKREDIPLVFTPPQTKKYGRLNMVAVDKPEYAQISAKFALKYLSEESTTTAEVLSIDKDDCAVYDMTPYSTEQSNDDDLNPPPDVNDEPLTKEDIEGEPLDDDDNKKQQEKKSEDGEPKDGEPKDGEPKDGEPKDGEPKDGEPKDGEPKDGEPKDGEPKDGEPKDGEPKDGEPKDGEPKDGEPKDGEPKDGEPKDGEPKDGEPGDNKPNDNPNSDKNNNKSLYPDKEDPQKKLLNANDPGGNGVVEGNDDDKNEDDEIEHNAKLYDILTYLEKTYGDLKSKFKRQKNLISSLDVFTIDELKDQYYSKTNIPMDTTKPEFIKLVTEATKTTF